MSTIRPIQYLVLATLLFGCSDRPQNRFLPEDGFSEDPIDYTDVSRTLFTEQNYLVAYSQSSGRLGIVDADTYSEIWGTYTRKDVPHFFPLPGHEGAGLVSPGLFEVIIKEGSKKFDFPYSSTASWSRAKSVIMLTAFDRSKRSLAIVKFRGENLWENPNFSPFAGSDIDLSESVVVAGKDGKIAVLLEPRTGSYVTFNEDANKFSTGPDCLSNVPVTEGPIKTLSIDEESGYAFVAIGTKIFRFSVAASSPCTDVSSWTEVYTGESEVNRIGNLNGRQIYAVFESGQVDLFVATNGVLSNERSLKNFCSEPLSVNNFGIDSLILNCAIRFSNGDKSISNAQIVVVNASNEKVFIRSVFFEKKSSVVFFPEASKYIELYDSAAGEFDVHTVPTGEITQLRGLFIGGILNKI